MIFPEFNEDQQKMDTESVGMKMEMKLPLSDKKIASLRDDQAEKHVGYKCL